MPAARPVDAWARGRAGSDSASLYILNHNHSAFLGDSAGRWGRARPSGRRLTGECD
jgi:hypothetical protein